MLEHCNSNSCSSDVLSSAKARAYIKHEAWTTKVAFFFNFEEKPFLKKKSSTVTRHSNRKNNRHTEVVLLQ